MCERGKNENVMFYMWLKLNYKLKIDFYNYKMFYVSTIITIKIPIENTQKQNEKEKYVTTQNDGIQREKERGNNREKCYCTRQTKNNEQNGNSKSFPISNYFKYRLNSPMERNRLPDWTNNKTKV